MAHQPHHQLSTPNNAHLSPEEAERWAKNSSLRIRKLLPLLERQFYQKRGGKHCCLKCTPIQSGRDLVHGTTSAKTGIPPILPYMGKNETGFLLRSGGTKVTSVEELRPSSDHQLVLCIPKSNSKKPPKWWVVLHTFCMHCLWYNSMILYNLGPCSACFLYS
jgi:hypothetical protein